MRSPRTRVARISASSASRCAGRRIVIGRPITSAALYPKMRSAPAFQVMIVPFRSLLTIASSDDATIAASIAWALARSGARGPCLSLAVLPPPASPSCSSSRSCGDVRSTVRLYITDLPPGESVSKRAANADGTGPSHRISEAAFFRGFGARACPCWRSIS